jgi:hypothetical protein
MTSTKIAYLIAVFVPFGCVALAAIALYHALSKRHRAHAAAVLAAQF